MKIIILFYLGDRWGLLFIVKEYENVDQIKYIQILGNYFYRNFRHVYYPTHIFTNHIILRLKLTCIFNHTNEYMHRQSKVY